MPEKVEIINAWKSSVQDEYIEKHLSEKNLYLTATLDTEKAYSAADFVVIAVPANYALDENYYDTYADYL